MAPNKKFKSFAMLTGTASTARLFAHAFGIIAQTPLHASCPLTKRYNVTDTPWTPQLQ